MEILPDLLQSGLKVVFCGSAVGTASAKKRAYYAGPGNWFWDILDITRLTPRKLTPAEFPVLVKYGIGLTDLSKKLSGPDSAIPASGYDAGTLYLKINEYSPKVLAFNGKRPAQLFFDRPVNYGRQPDDSRIANTAIFVLPSTSAAARKYWDEEHWVALADFVRKIT